MFASRIIYGLGTDVSRARQMGSYRLVDRLGQGGMGEVWRAEHHLLARPAAVKLIRPEALGDSGEEKQQIIRRFEREAQATAALSSPNTVELHEFGVTSEGTLYYVMELLRGLDLQNLVEKHGPVPYPRILYFLRQVCESLAEAHHNGLVHRDIKPANIYICRVGLQCDFVKVLDFGLVKLNRGEGAQTQLTAANTAAGTPAFMAPEIALGEPTIDGRADLYALGCVAYWLLTGRYVFEGNNAMKVVLAHVNEAPVPPSQQTELEVPAALDQLILECLEKKRENRPPSAADVLERLAAVNDSDSWDRDRAASWWRTHLPEMMA